MFDYNRGEFLRVLYTRDEAIGFLGRTVPFFILKPLQGQEINSLVLLVLPRLLTPNLAFCYDVAFLTHVSQRYGIRPSLI